MSDQPKNPDELEDLKEKWEKEWIKERKDKELKSDAMRVLRKLPVVILFLYLILHTYEATTEYTEKRIDDEYALQDSLEIYQHQVIEGVEKRNSQVDVDINKLGVTEIVDDEGVVVSTGNFEGPQLFIEALEFEDEVVDVINHPGIQDYSITSLLFDPDHRELGLPDLDVKVSPVKIYEPEEGKLKAVLEQIQDMLPGRSADKKPEPYAVYTKDVKLADGKIRKVAMQLWLTEFKVTVAAKPDMINERKFDRQLSESQKEKEKERKAKIKEKVKGYEEDIKNNEKEWKRVANSLEEEKKNMNKFEKEWENFLEDLAKNKERLARKRKRKRLAKERELEARRLNLLEEKTRLRDKVDSLTTLVENNNAQEQAWQDSIRKLNEADRSIVGTAYPGFWYSDGRDSLSVEQLKPENENQRYNNVKVWLRVMPNAAPWYVKTAGAENLKPRMAIGAIYCTEVSNDVLKDTKYRLNRRKEEPVNINVMEGIAVGLFDKLNFQTTLLTTPHEQEIKQLESGRHYLNQSEQASIWDKPYYMKIFLRNIGTYKDPSLIQKNRTLKAYDNQLTFHFLMPLLVRGSWDIIPPNEVIPEWNPPTPRRLEGNQLRHLIPDFGLNFFGRTISLVLMIGAIVFILFFFFPGLRGLLAFMFQQVADAIMGFINWIRGLFSRKKKPDGDA